MSGRVGAVLAAAALVLAGAALGQEAKPPDGYLKATARPGYFAEGGEARSVTVAEERGIAFDIRDARAAQQEALERQAEGGGEALVGARDEGMWA